MTPHDELMALADRWDSEYGDYPESKQQCAADLRALLDSDAFRAMVRDAVMAEAVDLAIGLHVIDEDAVKWLVAECERLTALRATGAQAWAGVKDAAEWVREQRDDAAIDAAASGAGEGSP